MTAVITPPKVARKDSFFDGGSKSEFIMELVIGNMIESFFLSSFFLVRTYAKYLSLSPVPCPLFPALTGNFYGYATQAIGKPYPMIRVVFL